MYVIFMHLDVFLSSFFLVSVFPTGCVRVNSSVGDGLGGFRLLLTYGCKPGTFFGFYKRFSKSGYGILQSSSILRHVVR